MKTASDYAQERLAKLAAYMRADPRIAAAIYGKPTRGKESK